ncbi:MAG: hypothetical protein ABR499_10915 [Gemmatimonadaceae bacterium]
MRKWLVVVAALCTLAIAARPDPARATAGAASGKTLSSQGQSWCDANAGTPVLGAVLCAAVADGARLYIRGLPFEVVAIGSDYVTVRPELAGERRRLLTIPYTAIRRLERTGRPRELILDQ